MKLRTTSGVWRCLALCVLLAQAAPAEERPWSLEWVENAQLPAAFRQFEVPRPDGSRMRAFITASTVLPSPGDRAGRDGEQPARPAADSQSGKTAHSTPRPLMIYLDGSGAQSQFHVLDDGRVSIGLYGLLARTAGDAFAVAACDKRGTEWGKAAGRPGAAEGASEEYSRHATFEHRVADVRLLIDALVSQPGIDGSRVVLVGHSEGADVAAGVAAADPRVTHVAFLSGGGASQMFDLIVLRRQGMVAAGVAPQEIEKSISELEDDYRRIFADPESDTKFFMGHAYRRWASFLAHPAAESLVRTNARLYLAHGSKDESVPIESFDLLVVELIRAGRTDLVVRRCGNCDHALHDVDQPRAGPMLEPTFKEIVAWAAE